MHGSVGIIIESDHTFLFEEEEYEGNDQAIAAPAHTVQKRKRIFLSWDAASWHASKSLYRVVDEMNGDKFRNRHSTPLIELMPLPSGAQFLNVIELVFSGMSRAILHNSNYGSVQECKTAIDSYFAERNLAFFEHPKRAGKKIWGKEPVEPVFREENNCKDARWR